MSFWMWAALKGGRPWLPCSCLAVGQAFAPVSSHRAIGAVVLVECVPLEPATLTIGSHEVIAMRQTTFHDPPQSHVAHVCRTGRRTSFACAHWACPKTWNASSPFTHHATESVLGDALPLADRALRWLLVNHLSAVAHFAHFSFGHSTLLVEFLAQKNNSTVKLKKQYLTYHTNML